jgi:hypothetical protein
MSMRERNDLEDVVNEKYKVLSAARKTGEFSSAVRNWWRMYDTVALRRRESKGVDITAYDAATDYVDMYLSWQ